MTLRWLVLGFAVLVSACGSSPKTQFYTLDPVPPKTPIHAEAPIPVQVAAVHIPPALDRQEMVRESAPHHLDVSDQNRWGGALDNMIQRVLTQDLSQRLPPSSVVLPQEPAPPRHDAIVLDILQFDQDSSGQVVFDGSWSLTDASSDKSLLSRHVRLSGHASTQNYGDQVGAMSQVLGQLSDNIAGELATASRAPSASAHAVR